MIGDFFVWLTMTILAGILMLLAVMGFMAIIHYTRMHMGISPLAILIMMAVAFVGAGILVARLMRYG